MAKLQSIVVTPEATVRDEPADFVVLPLYDGELGVGPGHTPLIGRLGFGEMRIVKDGVTTRLYIDGGFAQVADNVVSVMTSRAIPAESLDSAVAEQHLAAARNRRAVSPETMALRDRAEQQARAQIRVAKHVGK